MKAAFEAKATERVHNDHLKGLRELAKDHPEAKARYVVSLERHARRTEDGVTVLGVADFCHRLWSGALF
jgi:hypothetical protein